MSRIVRDIEVINWTYFLSDMINTKKLDPNNINLDEKSYKKLLFFYIGYMKIKNLTQISSDESKNNIKEKNPEGLWSKIKESISSMTSDDYDQIYMKIKPNSDDELPLNKMAEVLSLTIVLRAVFHDNKRYFPQIFLDKCLYKF